MPKLTRLACGAAVIAVAAALPSAAAAQPAAACPPSFELLAIPGDGSRPIAEAIDAQGNGDGYACQLPYPGAAAAHVGGPYNVVDNRVRAGF
jgi:hypothetical protein